MRQIFVNLPVKDLERSKKFFGSLGFSFNPEFTDDKAAYPVIEKDAKKGLRKPAALIHMKGQP